MNSGTYEGKTAQEWENEARQKHQDSLDSFERCDTDGFLSQWASDVVGRLNSLKASLAERDGLWDFKCLRTVDGDRKVDAKEIETKFGWVWILSDAEEAVFGRKFIPMGTKSRVQKQLGVYEGTEEAYGYADLRGNRYNVSPCVLRSNRGKI